MHDPVYESEPPLALCCMEQKIGGGCFLCAILFLCKVLVHNIVGCIEAPEDRLYALLFGQLSKAKVLGRGSCRLAHIE